MIRVAAKKMTALLGAGAFLVVMVASVWAPREAWANHCTLSGGTVSRLDQLSSTPNNELSCTVVNSRSDGNTPFPGFSAYLMFRGVSGRFGQQTATAAQPFSGEMFSVTMASFINLNPGDITGNMFGQVELFSSDFSRAPNIGPFMTDNALQSISVPCGTGSGDQVTGVGASGECPNSSNEANTSGAFDINPAADITSIIGGAMIASFQQNMNNVAAGFGAVAGTTEGFFFNSRSLRVFDFGGGAAVACTVTGTLRSTCARQGFTQFVGGALQSTVGEAQNDVSGTRGSRVTIEAAFAVTTLASGLHGQSPVSGLGSFVVAWHQLISQGDFQMNTLGSFRANTPAFMPAASYPTGLSLSSSANFLISQTGAGAFITRTPFAGGVGPGLYSIAYTLSNCLPGFDTVLSSLGIPEAVRSTAFGGTFMFRGAFGDFSCKPPP